MSSVRVGGKPIDIYELEQKIIDIFLNQSINEIKPVLDRVQVLRYPVVEDALGLPGPEVVGILAQLYELGSLQRRLYYRVVVCPRCGIVDPLLIKISCPNCSSMNISRRVFIKHLKCGYEGLEERFSLGKCPRCNADYTRSRDFVRKTRFECSDCGRQFKCPGIVYVCRNCSTSSSISDASFMDVYSYSISRLSLLKITLISKIKELLSGLRYEVKAPGYIEGVSGLKHRFDIYGVKQGNSSKLLVNIYVFNKPADEHVVMGVFAVNFDIYPLQSIVIVIPGLSESARQFSSTLKVNVIEALSIEQALESFKGLISQNAK